MGRRGIWGARATLVAALGGVLGGGVLALPDVAPGRVAPYPRLITRTRTYRDISLQPTGTVTYAWTAEPSLGCQADGLCGGSGAVTIEVANADFQGGPGGGLNLQATATARTLGPAPGTSCVDALDSNGFGIDLPVSRPRVPLLALGQNGPSAGRCAGPLPSDLARMAVPARRVGRGFDLRRTASETAGPYAVTLDSSLVLRPAPGLSGGFSTSSGSFGGSFFGPGSGPRRRPRVERVTVVDAVTPTAGPLQISFSAAPTPFCLGLGACGSQGTIRLDLQAPGRPLRIDSTEAVRRALSQAAALRDVADGRAQAFGQVPVSGTITETVSEPGQPPCTDRRPVTLALLAMDGGPRPSGGLTLSLTDDSSTALRTYCPGPLEADILSTQNGPPTFAAGRVTPAAFGPGPGTLPLTPSHGFVRAAYSGAWSGGLSLSLTRRSLRVSVTGGGR